MRFGVEKAHEMVLSHTLFRRHDNSKTAQKGNKSPGVEPRVPEKVLDRSPVVQSTSVEFRPGKTGMTDDVITGRDPQIPARLDIDTSLDLARGTGLPRGPSCCPCRACRRGIHTRP